jgi:hypothetical protein
MNHLPKQALLDGSSSEGLVTRSWALGGGTALAAGDEELAVVREVA